MSQPSFSPRPSSKAPGTKAYDELNALAKTVIPTLVEGGVTIPERESLAAACCLAAQGAAYVPGGAC